MIRKSKILSTGATSHSQWTGFIGAGSLIGRPHVNNICSCEICSYKGYLGVDIVEREYYDHFYSRDSSRYKCRDIEKCLDRIGRRSMITKGRSKLQQNI